MYIYIYIYMDIIIYLSVSNIEIHIIQLHHISAHILYIRVFGVSNKL